MKRHQWCPLGRPLPGSHDRVRTPNSGFISACRCEIRGNQKTCLVPTSPTEATHDTADDVRSEVEMCHFDEEGTHAFQGNFSKLRLPCGTSQRQGRSDGKDPTFDFGFKEL